ncbi:GP179 protein, partial [Quiscalus mexicanus]|nr:GP179 protein [Quiscalus mexicanus]
KSQSSEKAEICPWEVESSGKAGICPWEAAEPPCQQPKAQQVPAGGPKRIRRQAALASPERPRDSRDRASVCPGESLDTPQPPAKPQSGSSALPRAPAGKSQSSEKAEICPWETESSDKAEICPWEAAEPQMEKGTGPGKEKLPGKEASKAVEKG